MAYNSYYNTCNDNIDQHYARTCDEVTEKARIRRGAWINASALAAILADPTSSAGWNTGINAGKVIILPELSGTFDGGTPKMVAGYGDQKEQYSGSDFKATIKDPMYKANWAHYRSLVGKSTWYFAYLTETQVHITGKPVTVSPKNPITENTDDDVIWEAEISWFEHFTPAPHDAPLTVFMQA